ncbi:hypothetical protein BYT27DRAFT_7152564 [Phlegmacium glaucopus]|nr:hypothetical protein BYT27DRAFT_7152564 [Phlegmacium glaucopus]
MLPVKIPVTAPYLVDTPATIITQEEATQILEADSSLDSNIRRTFFLYEDLVDKYEHPFFMLRLANILFILKSPTMAMQLCVKAQQLSKGVGVIDLQLDEFIETESPIITEAVEELRLKAEEDSYYQVWKPTREHRFPFNLPVPPDGHVELRNDWAVLRSSSDVLLDKYLLKLSIETNRLETTFLLTEKSTQDLIHNGIDAGVIACLPHSALQVSDIIKSILKDTLAVRSFLRSLTGYLISCI